MDPQEDEELQRALCLSLQGVAANTAEKEVLDEAKIKHIIETLGQHQDKAERETAIQTLLAYARNILSHPGPSAPSNLGSILVLMLCGIEGTTETVSFLHLYKMKRSMDYRRRQIPPHQIKQCRIERARTSHTRGQGDNGRVGMGARRNWGAHLSTTNSPCPRHSSCHIGAGRPSLGIYPVHLNSTVLQGCLGNEKQVS